MKENNTNKFTIYIKIIIENLEEAALLSAEILANFRILSSLDILIADTRVIVCSMPHD